MKTIKDDRKRKQLFDMTIDNYINGNISIVKYQLSLFSKLDLIRFANYLRFFYGTIYIDINGNKELCLFKTK